MRPEAVCDPLELSLLLLEITAKQDSGRDWIFEMDGTGFFLAAKKAATGLEFWHNSEMKNPVPSRPGRAATKKNLTRLPRRASETGLIFFRGPGWDWVLFFAGLRDGTGIFAGLRDRTGIFTRWDWDHLIIQAGSDIFTPGCPHQGTSSSFPSLSAKNPVPSAK
jgi:hypothetical protein